MKLNIKNILFINSIFVLLFFGCTENIFYSDSISGSDQRRITGSVQLNDGSDPAGVLIWLKELNIFSFADSSGNYTLKIPEKSENVPGGGFTDHGTIYYYVANYDLDSSFVYIFDGGFQLGTDDINSEGILRDVSLEKLVDIVSSEVGTIETADSLIIGIETILKTAAGKKAMVTSWLSKAGALESVYMKSVSNPEHIILKNSSVHLRTIEVQDQYILRGLIGIESSITGEYEILPYLRINQKLPHGLLSIYGEDPTSFSKEFLQIPIRQKTFIKDIGEI